MMEDVEFCLFIGDKSILTSEPIKDYCEKTSFPYLELVNIKRSMIHDTVVNKMGGYV